MNLVTAEAMHRPEVARWRSRILERYSQPKSAKLSVVLPCSARKPYSASKSHTIFRRHIRRGAGKKFSLVHEVILTSPLGLVPRELEGVYPAAHYDVPVTGVWTQDEKEFAIVLLRDYMQKSGTKIIAHVDNAYRDICSALGISMTPENILSEKSLKELEKMVSESLEEFQPTRVNRGVEIFRAIADYQFGRGTGEVLIPEKVIVKRNQAFLGSEQIAAINPNDGLLALALRGGELLRQCGKYLVEISFKPTTDNIFCAGVERADEEIRPNDEVAVLYEGNVVGVGRAALNGSEMLRAKKGLAVALRHRAG